MMLGLGNGTTGTVTPAVVTPGFSDGLTLWTTPSAAITAVQGVIVNTSTAFASPQLPYTAGLLLPPVAAVVLLLGMMGGGR